MEKSEYIKELEQIDFIPYVREIIELLGENEENDSTYETTVHESN